MAGMTPEEIQKKLEAFKAAAITKPAQSTVKPPAPPPPPVTVGIGGGPCYSSIFKDIVNGFTFSAGPLVMKFDDTAVGANGFKEIVLELLGNFEQCEVKI